MFLFCKNSYQLLDHQRTRMDLKKRFVVVDVFLKRFTPIKEFFTLYSINKEHVYFFTFQQSIAKGAFAH